MTYPANLAVSLGVAAIGSAFNGPYRARIGASPAIPPPLIDAARLRRRRPPHIRDAGRGRPPAVAAVHGAFIHGWAVAMATGAPILMAAAVAATIRTSHSAGTDAPKEELRAFLAGRFAKWWLPDDYLFLSEIPKTGVRKFDKKHLRRQLPGGPGP